MPDLFKDIIPSIMTTKKSVITNSDDSKDYCPFVINKALSLHQDCLHQANEMNCNSQLPPEIQYQYLLKTVRSAKRPYIPWPKAIKDKTLALIQRHFGYSRDKAFSAMRILTPDQIKSITKLYTVDGAK